MTEEVLSAASGSLEDDSVRLQPQIELIVQGLVRRE